MYKIFLDIIIIIIIIVVQSTAKKRVHPICGKQIIIPIFYYTYLRLRHHIHKTLIIIMNIIRCLNCTPFCPIPCRVMPRDVVSHLSVYWNGWHKKLPRKIKGKRQNKGKNIYVIIYLLKMPMMRCNGHFMQEHKKRVNFNIVFEIYIHYRLLQTKESKWTYSIS